ncbi:hypothetical protein M758_3G163900 [Ceratodon purpureus]|nr:hypothetical protein M758_3G163900 [Ceratodon purpureus]
MADEVVKVKHKHKKSKKRTEEEEEEAADVQADVPDVPDVEPGKGEGGEKKRRKKKKGSGGDGGEGGSEMGVNGEESEKKRKRKRRALVEGEEDGAVVEEAGEDGEAASSSGRFTISMAVAGSIVDNAQSQALASRLAGQIARAAAIFRIDEIVVFDDGDEGSRVPKWSEDETETSGAFLTRLLNYMETPQYLRQTLCPRHPSLQFAGTLPPLDVPHQARKHEWIPYREGAVTTKLPSSGSGSCVNVGLYEDVVVRQKLEPGTRVTVNMGESRPKPGEARILEVVPKSEPREKGHYWGYTVRHASSLSTAISESSFPNGYDYVIGTSEHGEKVRAAELTLPKFKHILIVFGGVAGLEESKELDKSIKVTDVRHLFNIYLNVCPGQGSRTIRTEEAILISLQYLQDPLMRALGMPFSSWCE